MFVKIKTKGMTCNSCEKLITEELKNIDGIKTVKSNYKDETTEIEFDEKKIGLEDIFDKVKKLGFTPSNIEKKQTISINTILIGMLVLAIMFFVYSLVGYLGIEFSIPAIETETSLLIVLGIGLLTGFHCIGMCGGFVLSYTAKAREENPNSLNLGLHSQYAIGKIISYTLIGAAFGLLGSIFVFTASLRATISIVAGLFLILFGLKMLNIFPLLRHLSLPQGLFDKLSNMTGLKSNNNPLVIGLLNGLFIACGPLQAMYVLAAGSGSMIIGASLLFAFCVGTLVPLLGFGIFASFMSHGLKNLFVKGSAILVLIIGLMMINQGLILSGSSLNLNSITNSNSVVASGIEDQGLKSEVLDGVEYQVIEMEVNRYGWSPDKFVLKKGVPVKWKINGIEINGCNNAIQVPEYGLEFDIVKGKQVIEFTPTKEGVIQWSCWMGIKS